MGEEVLKKFGRYFLLDRLAQGGMAEIYRARSASAESAGRLLVIKRIQAGYGNNSEFIQMFRSEINVTIGFSHPNIVQLYDFGEEASQPYIAMEYVDGRNLRQFITRFAEVKESFPIELAVHAIEQVAAGLKYAHTYRDKLTGKPLNVVHRDISPQNILISYEGTVKIIDFGIAKASTNVESTRAGVIKGKPSYLSPEQISGEVLDGRSDIFSLGTVLWESLTGRKLFAGDNDLAVLKLIESCQSHVKPPSALNPNVPKELDYIVLKALAKSRDRRYQNAEEFQRALHKFLYAYSSDFNPSDLGYCAKDLFKEEIVRDRKRIQKLNEEAERILGHAQRAEIEIVRNDSSPEKTEDRREELPDYGKLDMGGLKAPPREIALSEGDPKPELPRKKDFQNRPLGQRPASGTRVVPEVAPRSQPQPLQLVRRSETVRAPQEKTRVPSKALLLGVAAILGAVVFIPPEMRRLPPWLVDTQEKIERFLHLTEARLVLDGNERNVSVVVNGQTVGDSLPATLKGIPVNHPFKVMVTGASGAFEQEIIVKPGERKVLPITLSSRGSPDRPLASSGTILLKLNITPPGGRPAVTINGKAIDIDYPIAQVPLDSPLELVAERKDFRSLKREFVIESSQVKGLQEYLMEVRMEPIRMGYLWIYSTPSAEARIMLDGRSWKMNTPVEKQEFPVGQYQLHLVNEVLGMEKVVPLLVEEGRPVKIDERLEIKQ